MSLTKYQKIDYAVRILLVILVVGVVGCLILTDVIDLNMQLDYCKSIGYDDMERAPSNMENICYKRTNFNNQTGEWNYVYTPIPEDYT